MQKTAKQVQYEREVMKQNKYSKLALQYMILKQRKTSEVDDYYDKKLLRRRNKIEKLYDTQTKKLIEQANIKEKLEENKDKTRTKTGQKKEEKLKIRLEKIKNNKIEKKETRQKVFDKAKKVKQKKRVMEEKAKGKGYCRTCGSTKCLQGGHVVKAQRHPTALLDINIHPQCYSCNIGLEGNQGEYFEWFKKEYGEEKLERLRRESKIGERPSIERMKEEIKKDTETIKNLISKK